MQTDSERSINLVIDLFEDWLRMYGSKLKDRQTLDLRTAELWTLAIKNSGITLKEFNMAAELSLNLEWPPTAAQDFIKLIKGDSLARYPDIHQAYRDAANCNYSSHEVLYETARRVGFYDIRTKSESVTYKRWQAHYPVVCSEHEQGMVFTLPVGQQIEQKPHEPVKLGSEADKQITAKLVELRRMAV